MKKKRADCPSVCPRLLRRSRACGITPRSPQQKRRIRRYGIRGFSHGNPKLWCLHAVRYGYLRTTAKTEVLRVPSPDDSQQVGQVPLSSRNPAVRFQRYPEKDSACLLAMAWGLSAVSELAIYCGGKGEEWYRNRNNKQGADFPAESSERRASTICRCRVEQTQASISRQPRRDGEERILQSGKHMAANMGPGCLQCMQACGTCVEWWEMRLSSS